MTTIVVESLADDGAPQVGVTVTGLDVGAQVVSVQSSWDAGNSWRPVGGGDHVDAVGGIFVRDSFPPLNVSTVWRVVEHSLAGEPSTVSEPLTVSGDGMWLQNPLDPRDSVQVVCETDGDRNLMEGSFAAAAWSQTVDFAQVLGADRPVASVGQRMIAGQVPLVIKHEVLAEGGHLRRLLMNSGPLVLRGHHFDLLEPVAHFVAPSATESRELRWGPDDTSYQVSTWDLTITQVRPLSLRFVVPWWTYQQVKDLYTGQTYAGVTASKPGASYLDWAKDPTP